MAHHVRGDYKVGHFWERERAAGGAAVGAALIDVGFAFLRVCLANPKRVVYEACVNPGQTRASADSGRTGGVVLTMVYRRFPRCGRDVRAPSVHYQVRS